MYKLIEDSSSVMRLEDGIIIPNAPGNRFWDEYQGWLSLGNTPQAAREPKTLLELKEDIKNKISAHALKLQEMLLQADQYGGIEPNTWDRKEREAQLLLDSDDISTALLLAEEATTWSQAKTPADILSATKILAQIILQKSQVAFISARISGYRARLRTMVESLQSIEEVNSFPYEEGWAEVMFKKLNTQ
jgi:hypothetical protein